VWHLGANDSDAYCLVNPETPYKFDPTTLALALTAYKLSAGGAVLCNCVTQETTHVISSNKRALQMVNVLRDVNRMTSNRFYVVTKEWVDSSVERGGLAGEQMYSAL
jgi:hypothetical protein